MKWSNYSIQCLKSIYRIYQWGLGRRRNGVSPLPSYLLLFLFSPSLLFSTSHLKLTPISLLSPSKPFPPSPSPFLPHLSPHQSMSGIGIAAKRNKKDESLIQLLSTWSIFKLVPVY